jgi:predicted nucleic acid-binding protein
MGDIEGYQKMSKVYDTLMKSGKFTAAQNKAENGEYVDSVSELVALCERDAFIPRYYTDGPQDKVDRVIQDLEDYTRNLILEELHLGPLIEKAIRNNMNDTDNDDDDDYDEETELERSLYEDDETVIEDEDYDEYAELQEELEKSDEALYALMQEGKA